MTDIPIPSLPDAALPLMGSELIIVNQGGVTKKTPGSSLVDLAQGNVFTNRAALEASEVAHLFGQVLVCGYSAAGDCGELVLLVPTTQPTSNPGVWQSADGQKWLIACAEPNPAMFGAKFDGTTDDTAGFQACLDFCYANSRTYMRTPFYRARIDGNLTIAPSFVGWRGCGLTVDWTHGTGAFIKHVSPTEYSSTLYSVDNLRINGPGITVPGTRCLELNENSNGVTFRNLQVMDCYNDVYFTSWPSFILFDNCGFGENLGFGTSKENAGYSIKWDPSLPEGPEQIRFMNCTWTSRIHLLWSRTNGEVRFDNCSFDGMLPRMVDIQSSLNGGMTWKDCHIETDNDPAFVDNDYWIYISGWRFTIDGGVFLYGGPDNNHGLIYMPYDDSNVDGLILANSVTFQMDGYYTANYFPPVVQGGTLIRGAINAMIYPFATFQIITDSPSANVMPYGDMESSITLQEWFSTNHSFDPSLDASTKHSGTQSLHLHFPAGANNWYTGGTVMSVRPGQTSLIDFWLKTTGVTSAGMGGVYIAMAHMDKNLNPIWDMGVPIVNIPGDTVGSAWQRFARGAPPAPPGAAYTYFYIQVGWDHPPNDVDLWIDDVIVNQAG